MLESGEKTKVVFLSFVGYFVLHTDFFVSVFKLKVKVCFKNFPLVDRKFFEEISVVRIYGIGIEMDSEWILLMVNVDEYGFDVFEVLGDGTMDFIVIFNQFFLSF
jgi:hypothetical protein